MLNLRSSMGMNRMKTSIGLVSFLTLTCGLLWGQTEPSARRNRFEAEQLAMAYGAHIADLDDEVERYRFQELFAPGATHDFDFPGFGDQKVPLSIEEYIEVFATINASTVVLTPIEFEQKAGLLLRATKKSTFRRTIPCDGNSSAAFAEIEVVFSFTQTAEGLKIAKVQSFGNPSTSGGIGSIELRRPGRSYDRGRQPSYSGMIQSVAGGEWLTFADYLGQTKGRSTPCLVTPTGVRVCVPETTDISPDDWRDFLMRWQRCEERETQPWTFISWRDEVQVHGNHHTVVGGGWSADILPSTFEPKGGFSTGLKYSVWMPLKAQQWNWGLHVGIQFLEFEATSMWDDVHWQTPTIDPDGMAYRRLTTASGFVEDVTVTSVLMAVGGGLERRLGHRGPILFSELSGGLFQPTRIASSLQSKIYHAGYYPDFHGVTIDHPEVYDFGFHAGYGTQVLEGSTALYASGLLGMRYIWQVDRSFEPTLSIGFGLNRTFGAWFVSTASPWVQGTDELISPLSTDSSSSISSRYLHLGLGIPLFTPDCKD
jgi:hypothetical protein